MLLALTPAAVYQWTQPMRLERALQRASLTRLEADARQDPDDPHISYYLGVRLRERGQWDAARDAFAHAATRDTNDERPWLAWAAAAGATQGVRQAFGVLTTFLRLHPDSAHAHATLAQLYGQRNAHHAAYTEALAAATLDPENSAFWRLAGAEAQNAYQFRDAETALRRAVALDPQDWRSLVGLGNALSEQNREASALPYVQAAARLAPQEALPALALGKNLMDRAHTPAQFAAARGVLQRAVARRPDLAPGYLYLGICATHLGDWAAAKQALIRATRLAPDEKDAHYALARVYRHLGDVAAAARELAAHQRLLAYVLDKRSLEGKASQGDTVAVRLAQARLLAAHGEYAQADDLYHAILVGHPNSPARQELASLERQHPESARATVSSPPGF